MIEPLVPITLLAACVAALAGFAAGRASALAPQRLGVQGTPRR